MSIEITSTTHQLALKYINIWKFEHASRMLFNVRENWHMIRKDKYLDIVHKSFVTERDHKIMNLNLF
jgi:hypothetical protein